MKKVNIEYKMVVLEEVYKVYNSKVYLSCIGEKSREVERQCHGIFDINIKDPHDCISSIDFCLNDITLPINKKENECSKKETEWSIKNWFTEEKVLPVHILVYTSDYLNITFKEDCVKNKVDEVQISFKKVIYDEENLNKLSELLKNEIFVNYGEFSLIFSNGLVGYINNNCVSLEVKEKYKFREDCVILI